mmetsp:Transcript_6307/g.11511  ORF Transcript_6307/g.11511 Transcript_6307/m.11511 type:complete len:181 (-) Transcript_6307:1718-2260(-)
MSLGLRPPNLEEGFDSTVAVGGGAGAWPKGDPDVVGVEPNALLENGAAGVGAAPPNAEPPEEPPKGLGVVPSPVPKALLDVELNGELAGAGAAEVAPKGDLFAPPPKADVLDVGAVVANVVVDTGAPLESAGEEPNGDFFSPPKGDFDAPNEAPMLPKPNDMPPDEGAAFISNGLDVLYF